jgi:hypothetical protein
MSSTTISTVFDENTGIIKNIVLDDNTLAPLAVGAGDFTTVGGDATEVITVTGALPGDTAYVTVKTNGATPRTISSFAVTADTLTVTMSGDPADDHVLAYAVYHPESDTVAKYTLSSGGAAFATGHRSLVPAQSQQTSASSLKTARRAEGAVTWSGSGKTLALTITGVAATDEVYAEIITEPTQAATLVSAVPTTNTVTFTLSAANTSNDAVIKYFVYS